MKQNEILMQEFRFGITTGIIVLCLITIGAVVKVNGLYKSLKQARYLITFHWLLEIIINIRNGKTPSILLDKEFRDFVENDAEFVETVIKQEELNIQKHKHSHKEHTHDPILKPHRTSFKVDKTKHQSTNELE